MAAVIPPFVALLQSQIVAFLGLTILLYLFFEILPVAIGRKSAVRKNLSAFVRFHIVRGGFVVAIGAALPFIFYVFGVRAGAFDLRSLPLYLEIVILFLAAEFFIYWLHRMAHRRRLPFISNAHRFHHQVRADLEWVNSKQEHFLVLALFALVFGTLFFVIFTTTKEARTVTAGLYLVLNAFSHYSAPISVPYLDHFFLFPKDHRRHHTERTGPYGITLSIFDTIFGTRG